MKIDDKIKIYNDKIKELDDSLDFFVKKYKDRLQSLRKLLRTDLNDLEKRVVKSTIVDEEKKYSETLKSMKDDYSKQQYEWKKIVGKMETKRKNKS